MEPTQINIEEHYVIEYGRPPARCLTPCHVCGGRMNVSITRPEKDKSGTYRRFVCVGKPAEKKPGCGFKFSLSTPDTPYEP